MKNLQNRIIFKGYVLFAVFIILLMIYLTISMIFKVLMLLGLVAVAWGLGDYMSLAYKAENKQRKVSEKAVLENEISELKKEKDKLESDLNRRLGLCKVCRYVKNQSDMVEDICNDCRQDLEKIKTAKCSGVICECVNSIYSEEAGADTSIYHGVVKNNENGTYRFYCNSARIEYLCAQGNQDRLIRKNQLLNLSLLHRQNLKESI